MSDNDDDNLISLEQIDRESPEMWMDQSEFHLLSFNPSSLTNAHPCPSVPGLSEYINKNSTDAPLPAWSHGFTAADLQQVQR